MSGNMQSNSQVDFFVKLWYNVLAEKEILTKG